MNNILVRSLTGAVFITLVLFPLFWVETSIILMFGLFMTLGLIEFFKFFKSSSTINIRWEIGLAYGLFLFGIVTGVTLGLLPFVASIVLFPLLFIVFISELWRKKENPLLNLSVYALGVLYIVLPFLLMTTFAISYNNEFPLLAGMFLLIWMNDTFAFLSGKFFGKTKLFERISPKKTWEGTIGGIVFTLLAAVAITFLFDDNHLIFWMVSAVIIAPCSIFGDLLESLFKRNMGIKDSGDILPGHGGVLDRFDSALLTVPFFSTWTAIYMYF
ncbi:MAG: phosphatidate cytidylyltransferase [Crocinitomicaceae bacterium]